MNPSEPVVVASPISQPKIIGPIELLNSSWNFFKKNWKIFVSIIIIPSVLTYIGKSLLEIQSTNTTVLGFIFSIVGGVLSVVMSVALIDAVRRVSSDPTTSLNIKDQYMLGFKYFWSIILVSIISGLAALTGFALFIIPGIIIGIYISLSTYALVIDGKKGFSALTESYSIIYSRWHIAFARLFVLVLVMGAIQIFVSSITFLIIWLCGVDMHALVVDQQQLPLYLSLFTFILGLCAEIVIVSIGYIYTYNLYIALKVTRMPEVSITKFKRWVIAFIIIGPIAFILIFGSMVLFGFNKFNSAFKKVYQDQATARTLYDSPSPSSN
jgi:hypothetical protein